MNFWSELKRRHVVKVGVAYALVAGAVGGAADIFLPGLGLPPSALTLVLALLVLGFPVALVLAWAYELTPQGLVRDGEDRGHWVDEGEGAGGDGEPATASEVVVDAAKTNPVLPADRRLIAVLPFRNLSGDPENEFFSDGITDDILTALTLVEGLKVISRMSAMHYKGTAKNTREIAAELGVGAVLEGSVRRAK